MPEEQTEATEIKENNTTNINEDLKLSGEEYFNKLLKEKIEETIKITGEETVDDKTIERFKKKIRKQFQKEKKSQPGWRVGRTKPTLRARGIKYAKQSKAQRVARKAQRSN